MDVGAETAFLERNVRPRLRGRLRLRSDALGETLPGYEASAWYGICGPKRTPAEVIEKLNKEVNVSIAVPKLQAQFASLGGTTLGLPTLLN